MKLYTDSIHKIAYSTDASIYREVPQGVAYPETVEDIRELIRLARERGTCLIPRAGGTSIAGQVVGNGIVVDISRHFNHILEINAEERWARVEPGVVRDELNIALKPYGLFFSPETSTSNRCCIGGMVGNNSCGTHSLIYGSTRHHVLQLKGLLADGSAFDTAVRGEGSLERGIYAQLEGWRGDPAVRSLIEANFPDRSLRRRSCGYAIDEALGMSAAFAPSAEEPAAPSSPDLAPIDLCKLICGSEGTLAFVTEIKVSLDPLPPKEAMVLCAHCPSLEDSFEANLVALRHGPSAVELMDGRILELGKDNLEAQRNRFFVEGDPAALLISEFRGESMDADADALEAELLASGRAYVCTRVYGADVARVWALRKAGLGVLSGMKGDAKPVGVIEDTAVAPERLPAYMADFRSMLDRLGLSCVFYGHISTGELHLRPIIDIKTAEGRRLFRAVAEETAALVRKHRGSLSGEHGDGRLRGEFIPLMYGSECYSLMQEVKRCWDPYNVFNMNKIVDAPGMDEWLRFEVGQPYVIDGAETVFNWRAAFDECKVEGASGVRSQAHALMCSIEQCNGAGDCRKSNLIGGTMCPAFKATRDELFTTRARANVLRECLTRGGGFTSPEVKEILDSCLACKGCRAECPSNVDMTRIRAEVLQQIHQREGTPLRSFAVARMAAVERLGHLVRPLYNFFAGWGPSEALLKRIVRFASERRIPALSRYTLRQLLRRAGFPSAAPTSVHRSGDFVHAEAVSSSVNESGDFVHAAETGPRRVYLFADEFTNFQEAELGLTFARLLRRLGYEVVVPKHVESGRAAISKGCLKLARRFAVRNVRLLADLVTADAPLVGIEPSCILSFRDEYPDLVPQEMRQTARDLAANCLLFDEFIMREVAAGRISSDAFRGDPVEIWLHGHCHQKALVGIDKTASALRLLPGATVHVIPSGCCGMAGSFGYEKEHYRRSLEIGEMVLFPAVRRALGLSAAPSSSSATSFYPRSKDAAIGATSGQQIPAVVVAPGTSCRQQILDGTGAHAVHPVELLYSWLR
jgi:FAD/FMN-containing dehydrogenase/Fe-S oxidoreductase